MQPELNRSSTVSIHSGRTTASRFRALVILAVALAVVVLMSGCRRGSDPPVVESMPVDAEHSVVVAGVPIHYFDFNEGAGGLPILWLHGYSGCGYEVFYIQDHLQERRIIAPDLPGLGLSGKPEIDLNLSYYLEFMRGFIRALELEEMILVGHSMGGKFAIAYAALDGADGIAPETADHPGLAEGAAAGALGIVRSLVLVAPYGLDGEAGDVAEYLSNTGGLVNLSFNLHTETLMDVAARLNVFHDDETIPEDLMDYIAGATFYTENGVRALANITRNAIAKDPIDWVLPEIEMPTLLVWGENDRVLSFDYAETFLDMIEGSSLVAVPECGHMPHVEKPTATAGAIREFLDLR